MFRNALLFVFSHRTLATARWDFYFARARLKNYLKGTARKLRQHVENMPGPRYLNLGSGPRGIVDPHWLNVDGFLDKNVHFLLDFSRPWPIPDASMDGVFCEHVLEHFSLEDGIELLKQCVRVLKPGGVARFIMPDAAQIMRAYFDEPQFLVDRRLPASGLAIETVNIYFRQRYEHLCLYDWALSEYAFTKAGFSLIQKADFRQSKLVSEALLLDDPKYTWESLFIDAQKAV